MGRYLLEPDLTERELAWIDEQIANGRFVSRAAAVMDLLGRGLKPDADERSRARKTP
jgi:Arc/MetJ-type ribon-helix-helix transcriptional regulator